VRSARKHLWSSRRKTLAVSLTVLVFSSVLASAATLANRDDKDHKVTIIEGDAKADQTLKPQQVVEKICPKGCVLRLNDSEDDEYQLEPEDMVSIEDGYLYHDTPDAAAPGAPPVAQSPAPAPAPKQ
jgi:hypothetical protein